MHDTLPASGVTSGRLDAEALQQRFADLYPPLDHHEALVASDRCYFCYDAPCVAACPTEIDIPMFIRQISTGNVEGAARTIFDQNILGGMCARVCPTETLCEQACVREAAEGKPVQIGLLQRHATDTAMANGKQFYTRKPSTGHHVAVIGAGPAGLACAHRLALHGHDVTIYEARPKPGGLNEYGIAAYKTVDGFAQGEVDYVLSIGGINLRYDSALGRDITLEQLKESHAAVFIGAGLGGVRDLGLPDAGTLDGLENAVDFIARLRQSDTKTDIPVGRRVVVIGGGMTAVDCAVQAKLLGAEDVTICYRRGAADMNASKKEQEHAAKRGVTVRHWMKPAAILADNGAITGIELEYTRLSDGKLIGTGETLTLPADQIFKAIGQTLDDDEASIEGLEVVNGRISVDAEGRTSLERVWAGGDCTGNGEDLTVTAVAQGRDAAESINRALAA